MSEQSRIVDIDSGTAMIVTDLHGDGVAFRRIREIFLRLHQSGEADHLIICGDLIHGYGHDTDDESLDMLLDVMALRESLDDDVVILLMGNHEMPHVYNVTLSKGNQEFTARFEQALAGLDGRMDTFYSRADVLDFLMSLPFFVRTKAGVLVSHAGASPAVQTPADARQLLAFDHRKLLQQGDEMLSRYDLADLRENQAYQGQVRHYLGVSDVSDPRYTHLLRGQLLSQNSGTFEFLWDVLFATNEMGHGFMGYLQVVDVFLKAISAISPYEQHVIVAGHIGVDGGYEEVGPKQLRLASYTHARPNHAGCYLLLNCEKPPVRTASQLVELVHPVFSQ